MDGCLLKSWCRIQTPLLILYILTFSLVDHLDMLHLLNRVKVNSRSFNGLTNKATCRKCVCILSSIQFLVLYPLKMPAMPHPITFLAFQGLLNEPRLCIHTVVAFAYLIQQQTTMLIFQHCCAMKLAFKTKCAAWCPPHHAVNGISLTKRKDFQQGWVQSTSNIHLEENIADENDFHCHLRKWHFRCHI